MIEHDMDFISRMCDPVIVMAEGSVLFEGTSDEVKKNDEGYTLFSAKVIEIPEVELPEKLITLDLLSQDTKKSINYDIEALEKDFA